MSSAFVKGRTWLRAHLEHSLVRNAYYLMSSTVFSSAVSFLFWIIAVRLYPQEAIGLSAAVLSTTGLLFGMADIGLGVAAIRFLPESGRDSSALVNSVLTVTMGMSAALAVLFLAVSPALTPQFAPVTRSPAFGLVFVVLTCAQSLTVTLGSLFLARRRSKFSFYQDASSSVLKLVLAIPIALLLPSALGLVAASTLAMCLSAGWALMVFLPSTDPQLRLAPRVSWRILRPMISFASGNHIARVFLDGHILLAPIIVLGLLGAATNAVFYLAWTSSMILRVIPVATFNSLLAEGVNDPASMPAHIRKALRLTAAILLPAVGLVLLIADYFLLILGKEYSQQGGDVLRLLALANIPWSVNYLAISIARVRKDNVTLLFVGVGLFTAVTSLLFLLVPMFGLIGTGIAYLCAQCIIAATVMAVFFIRRHRRQIGS